MKLHETRFWQEYQRFTPIVKCSTMRSTVDAWVYYKLQSHYQFRSILEIGFFEGQTAGLLAEVSGPGTKITCVDPDPRPEIFYSVFSDVASMVGIIKQKSQSIDFEPQDLIIIDGDKQFTSVSSDLAKSLQCIANDGVLVVNEWILPEVQRAIQQILAPTDWQPFLQTHQSLMFHHCSIDRSGFLDQEISSAGVDNFIRFENKIHDGHVVLTVDTLPIFTDRTDYFDRALKDLDL